LCPTGTVLEVVETLAIDVDVVAASADTVTDCDVHAAATVSTSGRRHLRYLTL
jgi:hypothetical protein